MKNIIILSLFGLVFAACTSSVPVRKKAAPPKKVVETVEETAEEPVVEEKKETKKSYSDVHVSSPSSGEAVSLPFELIGEARGFWFFEASMDMRIQDEDGNVLYSDVIHADGDWMTEDFVPFSLMVDEFDLGDSSTGRLIIEKANPSGLSENAAWFEMTLTWAN